MISAISSIQDRHSGSSESITRGIRGIPGGDFNPTYYPQDAYSSALDINCQGDEPRFPWQRDAATQCDFVSHIAPAKSTSSVPAAHPATAHLLSPRAQVQKKLSSPFNFRFWKSSSPLSQQDATSSSIPSQHTTSNAKSKPHCPVSVSNVLVGDKRKSVLQRAVSFDSRGYSKLIQGESVDIESPTQSIQMSIGDTEFLLQDNNNVRAPRVKLSSPTSHVPGIMTITLSLIITLFLPFLPPFHTNDHVDDNQVDRRSRRAKRMPNSAPDSFDEPSPPAVSKTKRTKQK